MSIWRWHDAESFEGRLFQAFSVIRMGDRNESVGALAERSAEQMRDSMFRYHVMHVVPRRNNAYVAAKMKGQILFGNIYRPILCLMPTDRNDVKGQNP